MKSSPRDCKNFQSQVNMIISSIKAAVEAIACFNEFVTFFQWLRSLRSYSDGAKNQELKEDDVLELQNSLQCLQDTLPTVRNFIDRAEWRSHEKCVADLLPKLKAAVYDAEDLMEGFQCYEQKEKTEGSAISTEPVTEFFPDFIQGNLKKLAQIRERLANQSRLLKRMGLHQSTPRFDRSVRPETTSFPTVAKILGRDDETKELIRLLGVPANNRRGPSRPKRKRSDEVCATHGNNEATILTSVPVLSIVGIGGVGKTKLAQNICSNPEVKKHFDIIVWIYVSDDFDVKRLTKEAIEQFSGKAPTKDNLNSLQTDLEDSLNNRRFLIVLDDMWVQNGELWKTFYAPFKHVLQGSMMLVTTRSQKVADTVRTTDPFLLKGLKDDVFQNFFKLCVFGSDSSNDNPELEQTREQILPKLKGSPLAAKTVGRLLGKSLDRAHWNMILHSQLWELRQEETDILPSLQLGYMYLPFHLKRCFSFCAVYPKGYIFEKEDIAQIWVAEGFVEAEHNIPPQQTGCKYFEELVHLSFFQKLHGKYVIHDLMHDMAQLVSKDECFIIKEKKDLERIPQKVRHLSVLKNRDVKWSDLLNLCRQTKLRTLFCYMPLMGNTGYNVMNTWCTKLLCMRVIVCASVSRLPNSISNMKNLRYLKILDSCHLPAASCLESQFFKIDAGLLNNFNLVTRDLYICNLYEINKDQAEKFELTKKKDIFNLTLDWSKEISNLQGSPEHKEIEVFEALQPPANIKSVGLKCYPGESLPSWSHGSDGTTIFLSLTEIRVIGCKRISSLEQFLQPAYMPAIKKILISDCTSLESVPVERFGGLPSLEELEVRNCPRINSQRLLAPSLKRLVLADSGNLGDDIDCSSLTTFYLSYYNLASLTLSREKLLLLNHLTIGNCRELETLNEDWHILKSLNIWSCPHLKWENGMVLPSSLQKLNLYDCGYFSVRCLENLMSLESLVMNTCKHIEYIRRELWSSNLPSLQELTIMNCEDIVSIGAPEGIAHVPKVTIEGCPKLKEIQQPLRRGYSW